MRVAPVSAVELAVIPLSGLAVRGPGSVVAVVGEWVDPLPPSRGLADGWGPSGLVVCESCSAPIRPRVWDAVRAILGDLDPVLPASRDCLWCGPEGVRRRRTSGVG